MTTPADRVEIITSVQRRRRWTASEKVRMVEETFEPSMTVSLVARRHGVAPNQLFTWHRLTGRGRTCVVKGSHPGPLATKGFFGKSVKTVVTAAPAFSHPRHRARARHRGLTLQ